MDIEFQRRYARHIILKEVGEQGQQDISNASILVIGAGGLGSSALTYLAAAGVGALGIIDPDHVELSNLQRQIIHEEGDIGRLKVESARDRISELNPACNIQCYSEPLTVDNAIATLSAYDIIIDGSDNFTTRFAVQDACYALKKPLISGAAQGFDGQLAIFTPYLYGNPCYRCFVPELPPEANNCTETGIIGPLCGIIGSMQALAALKLIANIGEPQENILWRYNGLSGEWKKSIIVKNPACTLCSD